MMTIYKYPLKGFNAGLGVQEIKVDDVTIDAKFLCVMEQDNIPCVWAFVNNDKRKETRRFLIVGTGHPIDNPFTTYIGSCQIYWYVAHIFEIRK